MLKIYIVDDEPWVVTLIENIIPWKDHGFSIAGHALDGETALKEIRYLKPHVVLTDIRMPGINGLEMISRMPRDGELPFFVVLTGHSEFQYAREALKQGVFDYLLKPVDEEELIALLKKLKAKIGEMEKLRIRQKDDRRQLDRLARILDSKDRDDVKTEDLESTRNRIEKAVSIIKQDYAGDLSLADISSRVFLSESYFSDCFSRETGQTFKDYLTEVRMEKARELLKTPGIKIKDVARLTGYVNPNYFCKVFRRKNGLTPLEYMNSSP